MKIIYLEIHGFGDPMERKTLKYFLDNKNFAKTPAKKTKKKESILQVVDDQIVMNSNGNEEEDGIVTSYTYMKNKGNNKRWTDEENEMFFKALECCGTDFSMINLLLPHRTRKNLRDKFKKEYKADIHRIEDVLTNFKKTDMEEFKRLKEKASRVFK